MIIGVAGHLSRDVSSEVASAGFGCSHALRRVHVRATGLQAAGHMDTARRFPCEWRYSTIDRRRIR